MEPGRCTACGADNDAAQSFCGRCGAPLAQASVDTPTPAATGWDLAAAGMAVPVQATPTAGSPLTQPETASWGARFGASILDGVILYGIYIVVGVLAYFLLGESLRAELELGFQDIEHDVETDAANTVYLVVFLAIVAAWLFSVAWDMLWIRGRGMSKPGQRAAGFRVVNSDTVERIGVGRAIGRVAAKQLYGLWYIGFAVTIASAFTIGLTKKRQGLHDLIASTACVRKSALRDRGIGPDAEGVAASFPGAPGSPQAPSTTSSGSTTSGAMPRGHDGGGHAGPFVP